MGDLRVVMADDSALIRQGVGAIIESLPGLTLVAEFGDAETLVDAVGEHGADVVLTDIRLPPTHTDEGIVAAKRIRSAHPDVGVVVLSQFSDPSYVMALLGEGTDRLGYLLKERVGPDELRLAVRSVADGGSYVDPSIVAVLVEAKSRRPSAIDSLTPREREVVQLIAEGLNNAAIAESLVITEKAVANYINSIFAKLGLGEEPQGHRRVMAVLAWLNAVA